MEKYQVLVKTISRSGKGKYKIVGDNIKTKKEAIEYFMGQIKCEQNKIKTYNLRGTRCVCVYLKVEKYDEEGCVFDIEILEERQIKGLKM